MLAPLRTSKRQRLTSTTYSKSLNVLLCMNSLIWFPQVAERWPLLFICPSLTSGTPRQLSQRDPRDVLLPGGRDVPQPCLSHQLPLCSPSLYEESFLQHRDHVSKRNQLVDLMHWLGCALTYCVDGWIWMAGPKWELKKLKLRIQWFSSSMALVWRDDGKSKPRGNHGHKHCCTIHNRTTTNKKKFTLVKLLDAEEHNCMNYPRFGRIQSTAPRPLILKKRTKSEEQRSTEFMLY